MDQDQAAVLAEYEEFACGNVVCRSIPGAEGFSGAGIWEVTAPCGRFALRRWPPGQPTPPRRAWMHRFLRFAHGQGLDFIAAPLGTRDGATFVERRGISWEIAPWLPGVADFSRDPRPERVAAALVALAKFHRVAELFPPGPVRGPSPGLLDRASLTALLIHGDAAKLRQAVEHFARDANRSPGLLRKSYILLDLFSQAAPRVAGLLTRHEATRVPILPCLRDVWHDHVLFVGDQVTGIIDYGALRSDSVAGDIARLLGSLVGDEAESWRRGIQAYETERPLSDAERGLLAVFDESSVLLSGVQWVRWIFLDRIEFPDLERVEMRMDQWITRLRHLVAQGRSNCTFPHS